MAVLPVPRGNEDRMSDHCENREYSARKTYDAAFATTHVEECPGCFWNGEAIFPEEK